MIEILQRLRAANITYILCGLVFVKLLAVGVSFSDCLGALVLLSILQIDRVISYLFPKRVDVFAEIVFIQEALKELQTKSEEHERDIVGLKLGSSRMR